MSLTFSLTKNCTVPAVECRTEVIHLFPDKERVPTTAVEGRINIVNLFLTAHVYCVRQFGVVEKSLTISVTKNVYCQSS